MDVAVRSARRRGPVLALLVVGLVLGAVGLAPVVSAHAVISETDPSQGSHVEEPPETITMTYTSGVDEIRDVTVRGPDGQDVTVDVSKAGDTAEEITVEIEDAGDGIYTIEWSIISADSHPTAGEWFFTAGDQPPDPESLRSAYEADEQPEDDEDDIEYARILPTGLLYLSVMALVGMPAVLFAVFRPVANRFDLSTSEDRSSVATLLPGASGLAALATAALYLDSVASNGTVPDALTEPATSQTGSALLVQLAVATGLTILLWRLRRRERQHPGWLAVAGLGGLVVAAGIGWTSHTASQAGRLVGTAVTLGHLTGAAIWVGGLVAIAVLLPQLLDRLETDARRTVATAIVRRFSVLAVAGVTLLVATGLGLTAWLVPGPAAFVETLHGSVLGVKLLLVVLALGLGASSRFVLLCRLDPAIDDRRPLLDRFRARDRVRGDGGRLDAVGAVVRTVRFEVVIVVVILLLSGALTATVPGVTATADTGPDRTAAELPLETDDLDATVTLLPVTANTTSGNRFAVTDGTPVVVELRLSRDGEPVELESTERVLATHEDKGTTIDPAFEALDEPGTYGTVLLLPEKGTWDVRLNVWTGETYLDDSFELDTVPSEGQDESDDGDGDRFGGILRALALLTGLVGAAAVSVEIVRFDPPAEGQNDG